MLFDKVSPYRSPPLRSPPRIESMRLRRYPLGAQLFIAAWFPITAFATAEIYPDTTFECHRTTPVGEVVCAIDESTPLRRRHTPVEASATTVNTFEYGPDVLGIGHERFDVSIEAARRVKVDYDAYFHHEGAPSWSTSLRSTEWLTWMCAVAEVFIVLFYFRAQVRTRLEADLDQGTLEIERTQRLEKQVRRRILLADVASFRIDDLTDDAKGHAVVARMCTGEDQILLTTVSGGAAEALHFLQSAKERAAA